jgi:hypothetical protein
MYAMVVLAGCLIEDVEIVIKFVGSLANSMLNFTLPGIYYFVIMRKYKALKPGHGWKAWLALLFGLYGLVMGIILTGVNVWTTISPIEDPYADEVVNAFN